MARKASAKNTRPASEATESAEGASSPDLDPAGHETPPGGAGPDMVLRVIGPPRGRWRAGKHFGPAPTDIAMDGLPDDDLAEIEGDPLLRTERLRRVR